MRRIFPTIKVPKEYFLRVQKISTYEAIVTLHLKSDNRTIGRVSLCHTGRKKKYITHSNLDERYHNKGLGILMYAWAINYALKKKWGVASSGYSSLYAQRVWRSKGLRKYFSIKYKMGTTSNQDKWYAYIKPRRVML